MSRRWWLLAVPVLTASAAAAGLVLDATGFVIVLAFALSGAALAVGLAVSAGPGEDEAAACARSGGLLEGLPSAVLLFDDDGLAYANAAARLLFDLDEGRDVRNPRAVLGAGDLAGIVEDALTHGAEVEIEVVRGQRSLHGRAARAATGKVALVVSDLTEVRRVDAVRRDFVTNASHELKTPVAGIQALSESLELAVERHPDRARHMIERLQVESVRLATLVRDLLDLARLEEASAAGPRRSAVDVAGVVRGQVERLGPVAESRGIVVEVTADEGATVLGVPEDVRLIAGNLIENAIRYNRDGGSVTISVRTEGRDLVLEVADTGLGIPEADRDRVFERFYRVDKGRSRAAGGTGLGLSLVRHATQRAGGRVALESEVGEGSIFTVTLPADPTA
jgi:signal transduction histidine kinase